MQLPNTNIILPSSNQQSLIAGLYGRVSSGRQENEETIDSQIDEIKRRIAADGFPLPKENVFADDGYTGTILERPGIDQMLDAAKAGKFQILYVYDMGRLARKYHYQRIIIEELEETGVKVVSLYDRKVESDEDQVMQGIEGLFHEYERIKIFRRFQRGKLYKAKQGVIVNGQSLYGYTRINKTKDVPAQYLLNKEQVRVVRMIFEWFGNESLSINQIIKRLHDQSIMPRREKQEWWTKGPLIRLLGCETYHTGQAFYNKSQAVPAKRHKKEQKYKKLKNDSRVMRSREEWIAFNVPKILDRPGDEKLFRKVQERLAMNKKYANSGGGRKHLLTGLAWCECGHRRSSDGSSRHGHYYYRCSSRVKTPVNQHTCGSPGINANVLDVDIWKRFCAYVQKPHNLKEYAQYFIAEMQIPVVSGSEEARISEAINKIKVEEERYAKAYGAEAFDFDQLQRLLGDTKKRKAQYQLQLKALHQQPASVRPQPKHINLLCQELKVGLRKLDFSDKNVVIRDVVDKVIIYGQSKVQVWGHLPVNTERLDRYATSRHCWPPERRKIDAV